MMTKFKEVLDRAQAWPPEAQAEAAEALLAIEAGLAIPRGLSDDDVAALERSAIDVRMGRFATDAQVRTVFERHRRE